VDHTLEDRASSYLVATVRSGRFTLALSAHPSACHYLADFLGHLPRSVVLACDQPPESRLTIISADPLTLLESSNLDPYYKTCAMLYRAWMGLEPLWLGANLLSLETDWHTSGCRHFVYLIPRNHHPIAVRSLLTKYVFTLKGLWLVQKGWLPLHAAAVVRHGFGFVFLGRSGAGKSTVARMAQGAADVILHDERIFLGGQTGVYELLATPPLEWGGHTEVKRDDEDQGAPLSAVFILKKDTRDFLVPVSRRVTALTLVEAFLEMSNPWLSDQDIRRGTQVLAEIARTIPGYELHFRKSPDFWKLIDEQFPD